MFPLYNRGLSFRELDVTPDTLLTYIQLLLFLHPQGVVHEVPSINSKAYLDDSVALMWSPTEVNEAMSYERWKRDLVLLKREYDSSTPANLSARTVFYLAQTYWCLRMGPECYKHNVERARMEDTWEQERYVAALRAAYCANSVNGSWPEVWVEIESSLLSLRNALSLT